MPGGSNAQNPTYISGADEGGIRDAAQRLKEARRAVRAAPVSHARHWRSRYLATGNVYEVIGLRRYTEAEVRSSAEHDRALGYEVVVEYRDVWWFDGLTVEADWVAHIERDTDKRRGDE